MPSGCSRYSEPPDVKSKNDTSIAAAITAVPNTSTANTGDIRIVIVIGTIATTMITVTGTDTSVFRAGRRVGAAEVASVQRFVASLLVARSAD